MLDVKQPKFKRTPPNFRRPDNCGNCRAFEGTCSFYEFLYPLQPEDSVCDDHRPEEA